MPATSQCRRGRGGNSGLSTLSDTPDYKITFAAEPKRMRVVFNGETIADSTKSLVLRETHHADVHYFPRADVRMDILHRTDHHTVCPFKGTASYWNIEAGGETVENAVWSYEDPIEAVSEIKGYISFYKDRVTIL